MEGEDEGNRCTEMLKDDKLRCKLIPSLLLDSPTIFLPFKNQQGVGFLAGNSKPSSPAAFPKRTQLHHQALTSQFPAIPTSPQARIRPQNCKLAALFLPSGASPTSARTQRAPDSACSQPTGNRHADGTSGIGECHAIDHPIRVSPLSKEMPSVAHRQLRSSAIPKHRLLLVNS